MQGKDTLSGVDSSGQIAGDISGQATYGNGQLDQIKGLIFHHTGGHGTPEGVVATLNQRGLGVQYVMDRNGKIFRTLPDGARGAHILRSEINDLSNANTQGVEVIANDDKDVTPAQVAAGKAFADAMTKRYPGLQVFGHGEVNPGHKQATEGLSIVDAFRAGQAAPKTDPNYRPTPIPSSQRTLQGYMGRDAPVSVEVTENSAARIGKGFVSSFPTITTPQGGNPLADLKLDRLNTFLRSHPEESYRFGLLPNPFKAPPLGVTPATQTSIDNSRRRGDTTIHHSPVFNVSGGNVKDNMEAARMQADRGPPDLIRNLKVAEQ